VIGRGAQRRVEPTRLSRWHAGGRLGLWLVPLRQVRRLISSCLTGTVVGTIRRHPSHQPRSKRGIFDISRCVVIQCVRVEEYGE